MAKVGAKRKKSLTAADIARVGPGTSAGEWFRRYWLVVGTAQELYDIPQAVKVLGEDLVLFRDQFGKFGLARRALSSSRRVVGIRRYRRRRICAALTMVGCLT